MSRVIALLVAVLLCFAQLVCAETAYYAPKMIVADRFGVRISGVPYSDTLADAVAKTEAQGRGVYTIIRPPVTVVVDVPALVDAVVCPDEPTSSNAGGVRYLCEIDAAKDSRFGYEPIQFPMSVKIGADATEAEPGRLRIYLHPDEGGSGSFATDGSSNCWACRDEIEIHPVEQKYSVSEGNWWLKSGTPVANYNGNQIAGSIDYALSRWGDRIDTAKGYILKGKSLGGAGVMHQPFILRSDVRNKIAIVDAVIGRMMVPKNDTATIGYDDQSLYDEIDIRLQWPKVQNIHYHWAGGSNDNLGTFDVEFFHICEQRKISCSGTWLQSGHSTVEGGYALSPALFLDSDQDVTLDKILPVITNNTSNYLGATRGWYNRGIVWNHSAITETAAQITIPIKYDAIPQVHADLPLQPSVVTFSVTLRHESLFNATNVSWVFGGQSGGVSRGEDGLITIDGLSLTSGSGYTDLIITAVN